MAYTFETPVEFVDVGVVDEIDTATAADLCARGEGARDGHAVDTVGQFAAEPDR